MFFLLESSVFSIKAGTLFIVEEASSHFKKEQMANIFYGGWVTVGSCDFCNPESCQKSLRLGHTHLISKLVTVGSLAVQQRFFNAGLAALEATSLANQVTITWTGGIWFTPRIPGQDPVVYHHFQR